MTGVWLQLNVHLVLSPIKLLESVSICKKLLKGFCTEISFACAAAPPPEAVGSQQDKRQILRAKKEDMRADAEGIRTGDQRDSPGWEPYCMAW